MSRKIVKIKHVTGTYSLNIEDGKLNDMQEQLDRCLNDEQPAIVVKGENGDQFIYPSDLLKNSFILITDKEEVSVF